MAEGIEPVVGIGVHPWAPDVAMSLRQAALESGLKCRMIDLASCRSEFARDGGIRVADDAGEVRVTHLVPSLLYRLPSAVVAFKTLEILGAATLNPVDAVLRADDKAATAVYLAAAGVPQVPTLVLGLQDDWDALTAPFELPFILKLSHGAQGRWVRLVEDRSTQIEGIRQEFMSEGAQSVLLQPFIRTERGSTKRVIILGGSALAWTRRWGLVDDWRSNVSRGGHQDRCQLTSDEEAMAVRAAAASGLSFAGIDLIRTPQGSAVLEVNAVPGFTSMREWVDVDIASEVMEAIRCAPSVVRRA